MKAAGQEGQPCDQEESLFVSLKVGAVRQYQEESLSLGHKKHFMQL